jgi:hypothetical protein
VSVVDKQTQPDSVRIDGPSTNTTNLGNVAAINNTQKQPVPTNVSNPSLNATASGNVSGIDKNQTNVTNIGSPSLNSSIPGIVPAINNTQKQPVATNITAPVNSTASGNARSIVEIQKEINGSNIGSPSVNSTIVANVSAIDKVQKQTDGINITAPSLNSSIPVIVPVINSTQDLPVGINITSPPLNSTTLRQAETTKTGNTNRTAIFTVGNRMFTCSLGFLEVCNSNNVQKCGFNPGTAKDLARFQVATENFAKVMESNASELDKKAVTFDRRFGANAGIGFRNSATSFRQSAKDARSKRENCQIKQ